MNVLAFLFVVGDKLKSMAQFYRTRESDFYVMFLFGGWVGGIAAMIIFRHKTRKINFLVSAAVASVLSIIVSFRVFGWM
jgi:uncharacterized membrane protein YsdA (DUF1294 family)